MPWALVSRGLPSGDTFNPTDHQPLAEAQARANTLWRLDPSTLLLHSPEPQRICDTPWSKCV